MDFLEVLTGDARKGTILGRVGSQWSSRVCFLLLLGATPWGQRLLVLRLPELQAPNPHILA